MASHSILKSVSDYRRAVRSLQIHAVDITKVADGRYVGDCDVDFIYAKVAVTVQAGKMIDIAILEHKNDRGQAAETVLDKMVTEQTIMVDAVAGATNSSIVLKRAVENALVQARSPAFEWNALKTGCGALQNKAQKNSEDEAPKGVFHPCCFCVLF